MKDRSKNLFFSILFAAILAGAVVAGYMFVDIGPSKRIFQMLGGMMPSGVIQFFTFVAFFLGMFEIGSRNSRIKFERNQVIPPNKIITIKINKSLRVFQTCSIQ